MTSSHNYDEDSEDEESDERITARNAKASLSAIDNQNHTTSNNAQEREHIKKFIFTKVIKNDKSNNSNGKNNAINLKDIQRTTNDRTGDITEKLEIKIPELMQGAYSFYTWPCAPILAWFLWERRRDLFNKRILELGSGCALPGILAAKCGARVILSDHCILPKSLGHIHKACLSNNLVPAQDIDIIGVSWGLLLNSLFNLGTLDLIIAADCFYDPSVFEDIIVTVSFLLERNPTAKFIFTYQERSADWSIEALLKKWKLCASPINVDELGKDSGLDLTDLIGGHTIHLIEITKKQC